MTLWQHSFYKTHLPPQACKKWFKEQEPLEMWLELLWMSDEWRLVRNSTHGTEISDWMEQVLRGCEEGNQYVGELFVGGIRKTIGPESHARWIDTNDCCSRLTWLSLQLSVSSSSHHTALHCGLSSVVSAWPSFPRDRTDTARPDRHNSDNMVTRYRSTSS